MSHQNGQTSSKSYIYYDNNQLSILRRENNCLKKDIKPFKVSKLHIFDDLNLL